MWDTELVLKFSTLEFPCLVSAMFWLYLGVAGRPNGEVLLGQEMVKNETRVILYE